MKNTKVRNALTAFGGVAGAALFLYGLYALYYEYLDWTDLPLVFLNALLCSVCAGIFTLLLFAALFRKKAGKGKYIAGFLVGPALFNALFWVIVTLVNKDGLFNHAAVSAAITVILAVMAVLCLLAFSLRAADKSRAFNIVMAAVLFFVFAGANLVYNREAVGQLRYEKNFSFDAVSAQEMTLTQAEKQRAEQWFEAAFLQNDGSVPYPFTFSVDGVSLQDSLAEWDVQVGTLSRVGEKYRGGQTVTLLFTHNRNGLQARVEATLYAENASCEWTVFLANTAAETSAVVHDFYGLYSDFDIGKASLVCTTGSHDAADDFTMLRTKLSAVPARYAAVGGRSSDAFLPYFNLTGQSYGMVVGIGWTGQWDASFKKTAAGVLACAKQERFEAALLSGEEVRSPLISVSFYESDNALKGFNLFRSWIESCVYPENIPDKITMMEVAGPMSVATADEILATLDTFGADIYEKVDYFWMDAGWYEYTNDWSDGVGTWEPDPDRYDNGIAELSDYAKTKDCGLVLWYEPERLVRGTKLYNTALENNGQWIVDIGEEHRILWNLADAEACRYLCETVAMSLQENGVSVYRQDFNFEPLAYWQKADADYYGGRTGIAENHYVTNLYVYLDHLLANVPGLIIDNCASGGRRLDLEMTRRSVPVWRSDYNCAPHGDILEATQTQTYGLSFWLPVTGTLLYMDDEYAQRSSIMPMSVTTFGHVNHENYCRYDSLRAAMTEQFYPLTGGSLAFDELLGMQYSSYDAKEGFAVLYKRQYVKEDTFTLRLNGLQEDAVYTVSDYDDPTFSVTATGAQLMEEGFSVALPAGKKAMLFPFAMEG